MSLLKKVIIMVIIVVFSFQGNRCDDTHKEYITLSELITLCELPGKCNVPLPCEGKEIKVKAYVDYRNVFDNEHYPQLSYEKFKIEDAERENSFEVWVTGEESPAIFEIIHENNTESPKMIYIQAVMEGVDLPTNEDCRRWLKLIIDSRNDIFFNESH